MPRSSMVMRTPKGLQPFEGAAAAGTPSGRQGPRTGVGALPVRGRRGQCARRREWTNRDEAVRLFFGPSPRRPVSRRQLPAPLREWPPTSMRRALDHSVLRLQLCSWAWGGVATTTAPAPALPVPGLLLVLPSAAPWNGRGQVRAASPRKCEAVFSSCSRHSMSALPFRGRAASGAGPGSMNSR